MTQHTRKHLKQRALTYREKAMLSLALLARAAEMRKVQTPDAPLGDEYHALNALLQRSQIIVKTTGAL